MKQVVLIGDSIRMGYEATARVELANTAEVWGPSENCGTSENVLKNLRVWAIEREADIVHLNCGLHDLRRDFGSSMNRILLWSYEENVKAIVDELGRATQAEIVLALNTPVNESRHRQQKTFNRFEADVVAYNEVLKKVAAEFGVPVNDLFSVVVDAGTDEMLCKDGVHFTAAGHDLLGKAVAEFIRPRL